MILNPRLSVLSATVILQAIQEADPPSAFANDEVRETPTTTLFLGAMCEEVCNFAKASLKLNVHSTHAPSVVKAKIGTSVLQ